ncbi:MAG: hypothetical protein AAGF94_07340 [Pseudomonadota bacterium]
MRVLLVVAALVCLLLPTQSFAAAFSVRSGEHNGFTRLVIYLDQERNWDIAATSEGYDLVVEGGQEGFDLSGVFEFIPKRRLTSVTSRPDTLGLSVACACPVQAFPFRTDVIVVDIYSEEPPVAGFSEARIVQPYENDKAKIQASENTAGTGTQEITGSSGLSQVNLTLPSWTERSRPAMRAAGLLGGDAPDSQKTNSLLDHNQLIAGIADAASHGLLTLADPASRERGTLPSILSRDLSGNSQLKVHDPLLPGTTPDSLNAQLRSCLPRRYFDVHHWGDPEKLPHELFAGLNDLDADDANLPALDAATARIRSYIYLGFGTEARQIVETYRLPERDMRIYSALAAIVDQPGSKEQNPLSDQLLCDSGAALWAFVSTKQRVGAKTKVNTNAVLRHFSRLPLWLRAHLGETARKNFEALGDATSANAIQDWIERAADAEVKKILEKELEEDAGDLPPPDPLAKAGSDRSVPLEAAHTALDAARETSQPLLDEDRTEVEALILEARGSDESVALFSAYAETIASATEIQSFEALLNVLSRSRFAKSYPLKMGRDAMLSAAAAQSSDQVLLGILTRNRNKFRKSPPPRETADAVIARLQESGFVDGANDYAKVLQARLRNATTQSFARQIDFDTAELASPNASSVEGAQGRGASTPASEDQLAQSLGEILDRNVPDEPQNAASLSEDPVKTLLEAEEASDLIAQILNRP